MYTVHIKLYVKIMTLTTLSLALENILACKLLSQTTMDVDGGEDDTYLFGQNAHKLFVTELSDSASTIKSTRSIMPTTFKTARGKGKSRLSSKDKILAELERRQWTGMHVSNLDEYHKAMFLFKYLLEPKNNLQGTYSNEMHPENLLQRKLILFPVQQRAILSHSATCDPIYMRLLCKLYIYIYV